MTILDSLLLGILQGIAEFLPISSSGHLILFEDFLGLNYKDLLGFDVVLHAGTLLAILVYFWKDIVNLIKGFLNLFGGFKDSNHIKIHRKEALFIILGTIPIVIAGILGKDFIETVRDPKIVSALLIFLALWFLFAEFIYKKVKRSELSRLKVLIIGIAQIFALLPGISRSGSIISAGIATGYERVKAARFAFLLGIPALGGAIVFLSKDILDGAVLMPGFTQSLIGFITSFIVGLLAIKFLMNFLRKHSLAVFSVYLLLAVGTYWLIQIV